jgi:hypothetical protein
MAGEFGLEIAHCTRGREGIENHPYLEELKDISESPWKVTLKSNPQKDRLLVDVLGRSLQSSAPICRSVLTAAASLAAAFSI